MKNLLLFANWKSNKTKNEARNWIFQISREKFPEELQVIILPPFTLLDFLDSFIKVNNLSIKLGAQDLSLFEKGAYTGEINAWQIKEFAEFVVIGHSERRKNFSEDANIINGKIKQANLAKLIPIVCVSTIEEAEALSSDKELIIAYEPPGAISTSGSFAQAEDPKSVGEFAKKIKEKMNIKVLYGGSVDKENVKIYTSLEHIDGVLVGGKSLDADSFIGIINNAC